MLMTKFDILFKQLSNQEEVEGVLVGELADKISMYAAENDIRGVYPVPGFSMLMKTLIVKDGKTYLLADGGTESYMFEYTGSPEGLTMIDFYSALGSN